MSTLTYRVSVFSHTQEVLLHAQVDQIPQTYLVNEKFICQNEKNQRRPKHVATEDQDSTLIITWTFQFVSNNIQRLRNNCVTVEQEVVEDSKRRINNLRR